MVNNISDNPMYDICLSYQKTAAMKAAVDLDIFTLIGDQCLTAERLSEVIGASPRGVRILCDFLCVMGFLEKMTNGYSLSLEAKRFLDRRSPYCLADVMGFYASNEIVAQVMNDPSSYVIRGGAWALPQVSPDNPIWEKFARSMIPFASVAAKRAALYVAKHAMRPKKILDVGAGHGLFGIEMGKRISDAVIVAVDGNNVLRLARQNADSAGLAARYKTIGGNAFDIDWGDQYDLVLLSNILHHFDQDGCVRLLNKAKDALSDDGAIFVIDIMPNLDRISPPEQAAFAFLMLATTLEGDAYTCDEFEQMAKKTGLVLMDSKKLLPTPQTLLKFKKANE
ncbi:MAG TPA: class I SAM-dependent methyltransferase [Smithella sp.]|nr:class I SAM-dependent methyltransferase [Smithella sp.]